MVVLEKFALMRPLRVAELSSMPPPTPDAIILFVPLP